MCRIISEHARYFFAMQGVHLFKTEKRRRPPSSRSQVCIPVCEYPEVRGREGGPLPPGVKYVHLCVSTLR